MTPGLNFSEVSQFYFYFPWAESESLGGEGVNDISIQTFLKFVFRPFFFLLSQVIRPGLDTV